MKNKVSIVFLSLFLSLCLCSCMQTQPAQTEESSASNSSETSVVENEQTTDISQTVEAEQTTDISQTVEDEPELKEFNIYDVQLEVIQFECYDFTDKDMEFLNDEQKLTFKLATFVYMVLDLEGAIFFSCTNTDAVYDKDVHLCHTGFTYESVMNGFKSVLSEDIVENPKYERVYRNFNGEFLCSDGARGASGAFNSIKEFVPVEITDEKVVFQVIALYSNPETREKIGDYTYNFEMVFVDDHWVMTQYEFWK